MIKILMGEKGTGKTKAFIEMVNHASFDEHGNVVCITNNNRHLFDLKSSVRMSDTSDFDVNSYDLFYGYICGIVSRDYDVTHIFIDSLTKITGDFDGVDEFLTKLEGISKKFNIKFTITISAKADLATDTIKKYLADF